VVEELAMVRRDWAEARAQQSERDQMCNEEWLARLEQRNEAREAVSMAHAEIEQRVYHQERISRAQFKRSQAQAWLVQRGSQAVIHNLWAELGATVKALDEACGRHREEVITREGAEKCVRLMNQELAENKQVRRRDPIPTTAAPTHANVG
jgi:hypothetical protein